MKQNLILRSAVIAAFGVAAGAANAGQIGVASLTTYASESVPSTSAGSIGLPGVTYQTAVPLNANANFIIYVHVNNAAGLSPTNLKFTATQGAGPTNSIGFSAPQQLGTDTSTIWTTASVGAGGVATNTLINIQEAAAGDSDLLSPTALATASGTISATWSMSLTSDYNGSTVPTADVDTQQTATIAQSATSVSASVINSASFSSFGVAETAVIDLVNQKALLLANSANTSSTKVLDLGAIQVLFNNGDKNASAGGAMVASDYGQPVVTVTAGSSGFSPKGTAVFLSKTPDCGSTEAAATIASSGASASATDAAFVPATIAAGAGGTNLTGNSFVCVAYSGTATITPYQSTVAFTLPAVTATTPNATTVAAANTYSLQDNGAVVWLYSYLPSASTSSSLAEVVRVVNGGSTSAAITASLYNNSTGALIGSGVLGTLPAGASGTWTASQVEGTTGAAASGSVTTLEITAPSSALEAATFLVGTGGVIADTTATGTYNKGAAASNANQ